MKRNALFAVLDKKISEVEKETAKMISSQKLFDEQKISGDPSELDYIRSSALSSNLQSIYTGIEGVLKEIANDIDEHLPGGESWHKGLIDQLEIPVEGRRPAAISEPTVQMLLELLKFRHVVRVNYSANLQLDSVLKNYHLAISVLPSLKKDLIDLEAALSSPSDTDDQKAASIPVVESAQRLADRTLDRLVTSSEKKKKTKNIRSD
jgi:hypothetical protein